MGMTHRGERLLAEHARLGKMINQKPCGFCFPGLFGSSQKQAINKIVGWRKRNEYLCFPPRRMAPAPAHTHTHTGTEAHTHRHTHTYTQPPTPWGGKSGARSGTPWGWALRLRLACSSGLGIVSAVSRGLGVTLSWGGRPARGRRGEM